MDYANAFTLHLYDTVEIMFGNREEICVSQFITQRIARRAMVDGCDRACLSNIMSGTSTSTQLFMYFTTVDHVFCFIDTCLVTCICF